MYSFTVPRILVNDCPSRPVGNFPSTLKGGRPGSATKSCSSAMLSSSSSMSPASVALPGVLSALGVVTESVSWSPSSFLTWSSPRSGWGCAGATFAMTAGMRCAELFVGVAKGPPEAALKLVPIEDDVAALEDDAADAALELAAEEGAAFGSKICLKTTNRSDKTTLVTCEPSKRIANHVRNKRDQSFVMGRMAPKMAPCFFPAALFTVFWILLHQSQSGTDDSTAHALLRPTSNGDGVSRDAPHAVQAASAKGLPRVDAAMALVAQARWREPASAFTILAKCGPSQRVGSAHCESSQYALGKTSRHDALHSQTMGLHPSNKHGNDGIPRDMRSRNMTTLH